MPFWYFYAAVELGNRDLFASAPVVSYTDSGVLSRHHYRTSWTLKRCRTIASHSHSLCEHHGWSSTKFTASDERCRNSGGSPVLVSTVVAGSAVEPRSVVGWGGSLVESREIDTWDIVQDTAHYGRRPEKEGGRWLCAETDKIWCWMWGDVAFLSIVIFYFLVLLFVFLIEPRRLINICKPILLLSIFVSVLVTITCCFISWSLFLDVWIQSFLTWAFTGEIRFCWFF